MFAYTRHMIEAKKRDGTLHHIALRVGRGEDVLWEHFDSTDDLLPDADTLFDMASVTKVAVTTTLALIAWDRGLLSPNDPVSRFFPVPEHNKTLTVRHLLTHTTGVGWRQLHLPQNTYENIATAVLALTGEPVGSDVRYSCPGYVLLGKIVEQVLGDQLDHLFQQLVAEPLGMTRSGFLPLERGLTPIVNGNFDGTPAGIVNDNNCRHLGGVAGNAGLFSTLRDMTAYVSMLCRDGAPLFSADVMAAACRNYTPEMAEDRGLGFLYVTERYSQTGHLFPEGAIGHCGHTGQSVFLHRESGLYVIALTDATASVKNDYDRVIALRQQLHSTIAADLMNG